jgi:microcystin-dependent protein
MNQCYVGEIRAFATGKVPEGWLPCLGQRVSSSQYDVLYNLIGTTYGGDDENFALPDLRGRVPICLSPEFPIGRAGGLEQVKLIPDELPSHRHTVMASSTGGSDAPKGMSWGASSAKTYKQAEPTMNMNGQSLNPAGGDLPHENMQPFLVITYAISLDGIYPPHP